MSKRDREEELRSKLSSYTTYRIVSTGDDIEDPNAPPVTSIAELPKGEWFVIGKSGRKEEWSDQAKPAIDMFNTQAKTVQCAICKTSQAGPNAFAAMRLSEDGKNVEMQAVCLDCVATRNPKELRDALAGYPEAKGA